MMLQTKNAGDLVTSVLLLSEVGLLLYSGLSQLDELPPLAPVMLCRVLRQLEQATEIGRS